MLQVRSTHRLDQIEMGLLSVAERHGASVLATTHLGQLLGNRRLETEDDAVTFTLCMPGLYGPLLKAEIRFAAFLPARVTAYAHGDRVMLEAISPCECCRMIHRLDLEWMAAPLEATLRRIMEEAATSAAHAPDEHCATEDQVNMRAALPQRIDCHGSKVEDLAGIGVHDSQGG
jgi:uncharacterized protein (DUF302 family)